MRFKNWSRILASHFSDLYKSFFHTPSSFLVYYDLVCSVCRKFSKILINILYFFLISVEQFQSTYWEPPVLCKLFFKSISVDNNEIIIVLLSRLIFTLPVTNTYFSEISLSRRIALSKINQRFVNST